MYKYTNNYPNYQKNFRGAGVGGKVVFLRKFFVSLIDSPLFPHFSTQIPKG